MPHGDRRRWLFLFYQMRNFNFCITVLFILVIFSILLNITTLFNHDHDNNNNGNNNNGLSHKERIESSLHHFILTDSMIKMDESNYYLGEAYDKQSGKFVEGRLKLLRIEDIIQDEDNDETSREKKSHGTGPCVDPFGPGARWKQTEDIVIDSTNDQGLSDQFFADCIWNSAVEWDSKLLFHLFGQRDNVSVVDGPDTISPDGLNEYLFAIVADPGVIAFTITWGVFSGPIQNQEIVEVDIVFSLNFRWGDATQEINVMDCINIATHEIGHGVGFGHILNFLATMFSSAAFDETIKRTLLPCEIEGLCIHYGETQSCPGHNSTGTIPPDFKNSASLTFANAPLFILVILIILNF